MVLKSNHCCQKNAQWKTSSGNRTVTRKSSIGELYSTFVQWGLTWFWNLNKHHCFIVLHISTWEGDWSFVSEGLSPPKVPRGDWIVWQNFSLLFNAIESEKYLCYAICQACKRRYVKLSVYKHDSDQSDTTHSSVYSASRQNLCWDYFAFIWTQLVEVVIWQAWYTWLGFRSLWLVFRIRVYGQVLGLRVQCLVLGFSLQFT